MLDSTMGPLAGIAFGQGKKELTESEFDKDGDKPGSLNTCAACLPVSFAHAYSTTQDLVDTTIDTIMRYKENRSYQVTSYPLLRSPRARVD